MQFPCTQVCEGSRTILESIWQERDRHSLQAFPVIARPMEQNGLFCSIKLFKPQATDAFNALNNVFQIMYFYLKKKNKDWYYFKCPSSPIHNTKMLKNCIYLISNELLSMHVNQESDQHQQALHLTPKCRKLLSLSLHSYAHSQTHLRSYLLCYLFLLCRTSQATVNISHNFANTLDNCPQEHCYFFWSILNCCL